MKTEVLQIKASSVKQSNGSNMLLRGSDGWIELLFSVYESFPNESFQEEEKVCFFSP